MTLDKANFSTGSSSSSKLHVLVSCESYLRSLREKIRRYEMEAKLREAARGHRQQSPSPSPSTSPSPENCNSLTAASPRDTRDSSGIQDWAAKDGRAAAASGGSSSRSVETDRMDTGDDCSMDSSSASVSAKRSSRRRRRSITNKDLGNPNSNPSSGNNNDSSKQPLYSASSSFSSSDDDENSLAGRRRRSSGSGDGGVMGIAGVTPRGASSNDMSSSSAGDNSSSNSNDTSSTGSDGDSSSNTGSSDSGGGSTSAGTTDSASQGFTTDTASRGFTTDSSFSGYTGSLGSGSADTGSADGGSDESEEGTSSSRMRVVNYFDIFRLSNVPMAIADKAGALVDVNDAMRGFGRIDQDTVNTLTVSSLVAPESSKVRWPCQPVNVDVCAHVSRRLSDE